MQILKATRHLERLCLPTNPQCFVNTSRLLLGSVLMGLNSSKTYQTTNIMCVSPMKREKRTDKERRSSSGEEEEKLCIVYKKIIIKKKYE